MADSVVDSGVLSVSLSTLVAEATGASSRRMGAADQLALDSERMWSINMTTPSQNAALALRTATESGSGRTRAETNNPVQTGVGTPGATAVK